MNDLPASCPKGSVRDWVDLRATETPDTVSHIFATDGSQLTWGELRDEARIIAGRLTGLSIQKGESVGLCLPNGREAILCLFGVLYGGFRATALNLVAGADAIGYAISHSQARFVFVGDGQRQLFDEAQKMHPGDVTVLAVDDGVSWPDGTDIGSLFDVDGNDHALLMYTSGTTGRPKGVVHSQTSLLAGGWTTAVAHELSTDDRALCVLPYYHINGLCVTIIAPLISGGSSIIADKFSVSRFWGQCERYKATWFSIVPTIVSHLLHGESGPSDEVVTRLRFARSASSALAPDVQSAFEERFDIPIVETMGLTETAAQILSNPLPPGLRKNGSPGVAVGNEISVRTPEGTVKAGEQGEIAVRGPNVMVEYLNNPEATAETFTSDGWLLTGDLGFMDEDGYVFVTGRSKELIIKGGENIAPREIDEALYSHPDVVEAAAFARKCKTYGERVEAAVAVKPGSTVSEKDLVAICNSRLGTFKSPDTIHFMDELPKGPSGKIQRMKLAVLAQ